MNIDEAYNIISDFYSIQVDDLKSLINKHFNIEKRINTKDKNIILPFCGVINEDCCKAIVYNHGLYTQCTKKTKNELCSGCIKLKYGKIEDRLKFEKDKFVTENGKKEVPYEKFMKKMDYSYEEVIKKLKEEGLSYDLMNNDKQKEIKKGRGRPKKIKKEDLDSDTEEIEVTKVIIDDVLYLKTSDDVILDLNTHQVVGVYKDGIMV
jgi:hypothetical protein